MKLNMSEQMNMRVRVVSYLPVWIVWLWFACHAIFWFFLNIALHCGKPFTSIHHVRQSEFFFLFRPPWGPCSTFWWPRKPCVQVLREGDKSSRRLADKASYRLAIHKPFGMPIELHWACSSSFYPFDSLSSEGYSWSAYSKSLLGHSSEGDMA